MMSAEEESRFGGGARCLFFLRQTLKSALMNRVNGDFEYIKNETHQFTHVIFVNKIILLQTDGEIKCNKY